MRTLFTRFLFFIALLLVCNIQLFAQQGESIYGDAAKADVKMNYVYSYEDAIRKARAEKKLIFFNCFADWAVPCHGMNKMVFSDQQFCDYMDKTFVNLFIDVTTETGRPLAEKYGIKTFAQYLVLDENGEIVHRIVGGSKLPEFKDLLEMSLSPKTSLKGMNEKYATGKYDKKFLLTYAEVLSHANEMERYKQICKEYMGMITPKEYCKKENWGIFTSLIDNRNNELYQYLVDHKAEFVKENGLDMVNVVLERQFIMEVLNYAQTATASDAKNLMSLFDDIQKAHIPDSSFIYFLYDIGKLRMEKKYEDILVKMDEYKSLDDRLRVNLELSFDFPEMTDKQRQTVIAYLLKASERETSQKVISQLKQMANLMENYEGIIFEQGKMEDVLKKAAEKNMPIFLDCYTSWCGPCKMMAKNVFTLPQIGKFFNEHFVNYKLDMEKGEGIEIAKKYGIKAYPTLIFIDAKGNLISKSIGAKNGNSLIQFANDALNADLNYTEVKAAYEKGEKTGTMLINYIKVMRMADEMDEKEGQKLLDNYLAGLSADDYYHPSNWALIKEMSNDVNGKLFDTLVKNHQTFANQNGEEQVNKQIEKVVFPYFIDYLNNRISYEQISSVMNRLNESEYPAEYSLMHLKKLLPLVNEKNVTAILSYYKDHIVAISNSSTKLNLDVLLHNFLDIANEAQKIEMKNYAEQQLDGCDPRAKNGYLRLLSAIQESL